MYYHNHILILFNYFYCYKINSLFLAQSVSLKEVGKSKKKNAIIYCTKLSLIK